MNDDIKEILQSLKESYDETIPKQEFNRYLKYIEEHITNLQQEKERLKTNLGELQNAIDNIAKLVDVPEGMSVEDVYDKVKDYKSRCEKAVEYIQNHQLVFELSSKKVISQWFDMFYKDSLNILNGDNNE